MPATLTPVPLDTPIIVETSHSASDGPELNGVDITTQWWCEVTRRPRSDDAVARVTPPGAGHYDELLCLTLPADDLDDTETVGRFAVNVTRALIQVLDDPADSEASGELKALLSPTGPMGDDSGPAWDRVLEWLDAARAGQVEKLNIAGNGWPQTWTITEVAEFLGYTGASATGSARKQLSRWGINATGRRPGRGGESLYATDEVRAAHLHRPGRGARTDLAGPSPAGG